MSLLSIEVKDKKLCRIEGCMNRRSKVTFRKYRSVCNRHWYEQIGRLAEYSEKGKDKLKELSSTPCSKCGWNLSYTDRHRVTPGRKGGQYTPDNTVSICPNCHRVETFAGLLMSNNAADKKRIGSDYILCAVEGCINRTENAGYGRFRSTCRLHTKGQKVEDSTPQKDKKEFRKEMRKLLVIAETKGLQAVKGRLNRLLSK